MASIAALATAPCFGEEHMLAAMGCMIDPLDPTAVGTAPIPDCAPFDDPAFVQALAALPICPELAAQADCAEYHAMAAEDRERLAQLQADCGKNPVGPLCAIALSTGLADLRARCDAESEKNAGSSPLLWVGLGVLALGGLYLATRKR